MQFRKLLNKLIDETLPEWRDKFLCYKDLKKQLKRVYSRDGRGNKRIKLSNGDETDSIATEKEVADFVKLCQEQIDKFNDFVLEKQEWYLIKIEVLEGNLIATKDSNEELWKIGRTLADLHGEIVLLLNYSWLNYTGLVKILKKHDRLSGALVRVPFIQKVMKEPFYEPDVLNNLAKKCDTMLEQLFSMNEPRTSASATSKKEEETIPESSSAEPKEKSSPTVPEELVDIKHMENDYMKLTLSALNVLQELRSGSSTASSFSLPVMQQSMERKEVWKESLAVEVAK
ncbi:SPX domain-containing protein 2-like [Cynara cardunculus var. scolymus]|uniref:SPX, N-terminal n=1 Tax=Cynara cardunculus var. scolymus TaxID=59895 RepID=A0A103XZM7_CYNCS|nr:SPX domain-containing protein 2-like [Cynara cardunculus var. scolymus]KVH99830.1 SPX, N-terminal [Cynara cardunculus var. scolymus]